VLLDEATCAFEAGNEASPYARLSASGATRISIAHWAAVLKHYTHVLHLPGRGAREVLEGAGLPVHALTGETTASSYAPVRAGSVVAKASWTPPHGNHRARVDSPSPRSRLVDLARR